MKKLAIILVLLLTSGFVLSSCEVTAPENDITLKEGTVTDIDLEPTASPTIQDLTDTTSSPGALMQNNDTVPVATQATIKTHKGDIVVKLYADQAPNTVANFVQKAAGGFYENLTFHRVEDWVIQGGDPDGNGTGGGKMATELNQVPFKAGSLGVARGGDIKVSNDAQFFICTTDCAWLTGQYTNFGEVISGMDIAKQIQIGDRIISISYE